MSINNNKFLRSVFLSLISSFLVIPLLINFNLNTLPAAFNYLAQALPFALVFIIGILWAIFAKPEYLCINRCNIYLLALAFSLAMQYAYFRPDYSASYLIIFLLFVTASVVVLAANNSGINYRTLLRAIAIGILVGGYYQTFYSILLLSNLTYSTEFTIYAPVTPYKILMQWFRYPGQVVGSIGQVNVFAEIVCWGILANCWLYKPQKTYNKLFFYFTTIIFSVFIALTQSRAVYLYVIVLLTYCFYLYRFNNDKIILKNLIISLIILVFCLLVFYINSRFIHIGSSSAVILSPRSAERANLSNLGRIIMGVKGLIIFIQHPIIGVGWDSYSQYYGVTQLPSFITPPHNELTTPSNAHNIVVQLLATTGLIGTLLVTSIIILIINQLRKRRTKTQFLPLAVLLVTLTHSTVEYPLFNSFIFIPIALLIGITDNNFLPIKLPVKPIKIIVVLFSLAGIWQFCTGVNSYLLLAQFKPPKHYQANDQLNNEFSRYFAVSTNPLWDDYADMTLSNNLMFNSKPLENPTYFEFFKITLGKINHHFPNPPYTLKLAIMEVIDDNPAKAKALIKELKYNYPGYEKMFESYVIQQTPNNTSARNSVINLITDTK